MSAVATPADEPSGRICLVDDHAEFRQSAAWWLESLGYEVECWEEPVAFLEAMTERPAEPACFLLDVRMPGMSGLELMEAARERGLNVPDDLSIIGFDDTATAAHIWPPLTTVRWPIRAMAKTAAAKLIRPASAASEPSFFLSDLIRRASAVPRSAA
jgi:CheY-like chemotaxis protein